jgi:hypothetical protein
MKAFCSIRDGNARLEVVRCDGMRLEWEMKWTLFGRLISLRRDARILDAMTRVERSRGPTERRNELTSPTHAGFQDDRPIAQ